MGPPSQFPIFQLNNFQPELSQDLSSHLAALSPLGWDKPGRGNEFLLFLLRICRKGVQLLCPPHLRALKMGKTAAKAIPSKEKWEFWGLLTAKCFIKSMISLLSLKFPKIQGKTAPLQTPLSVSRGVPKWIFHSVQGTGMFIPRNSSWQGMHHQPGTAWTPF